MNKAQIVGVLGATVLSLGGIDASVLNERPVARIEQIGEERVEAKQIDNEVHTTFPWKDQPGLIVKVDLGEPTLLERFNDKRKREVITEVVDFGEGGFKVDILLHEKPDTNRFCYVIEGAENYDFFYQPPLNEEIEPAKGETVTATHHYDAEGNVLAERPENIVGSLSVYHKALKNHQVGRENYATGKVMQIPRPEVWSLSNEKEKQWAELSYEDDSLCVTAPQEFIDMAEYPVRIDPTFGYTSAGASASFNQAGQYLRGSTQNSTVSSNGEVMSVTIYGGAGFAGDANIKGVVTDNSNVILANGITNPPTTWPTADDYTWREVPFSSPRPEVTAGNEYYPWWINDNTVSYYYDTGGASNSSYTDTSTSYASPPNPTDASGTTNLYSIYATYELPPDLEQEGFAFGDDDGSESSHTLEIQDTNITEPLGTKTLRSLITASSTATSSTAFKLRYQKNGSGGYADVQVGATSGGGDLVVDAADTTSDFDNVTTADIDIDLPAFSTGDLVIVAYNLWSNSAAKTVTWASGPDGETVTSITNSTGAGTADTVYLAIGYFIATADYAGGSMANDASASTRWAGAVVVVPSGEYDSTDPISAQVASDADTSDVAGIDMPGFTSASDDDGGKLLVFVGADQDPFNATMPSGYTSLEILDGGRSAALLAGRDTAVSNSESISAATFDLNGAAADAMTIYAFIVRPAPETDNEVYISASTNVTSGGESTTARLAAPSGKTTGDFDTGRRWDDENGSDSVDIGANEYTELEWVLTTQAPATTTDYFDFRVYNSDNAIDTYTVTPRWTIGTGGGGEQAEPNPDTIFQDDVRLEDDAIFSYAP